MKKRANTFQNFNILSEFTAIDDKPSVVFEADIEYIRAYDE